MKKKRFSEELIIAVLKGSRGRSKDGGALPQAQHLGSHLPITGRPNTLA